MSPWDLYGWIAPGTMKAPLKRIKHFAKEKKMDIVIIPRAH